MASTASEIWKQTDRSNKESICPQMQLSFYLGMAFNAMQGPENFRILFLIY